MVPMFLAECNVLHDVLLECAKGGVPDKVYTSVMSTGLLRPCQLEVHHLCLLMEDHV